MRHPDSTPFANPQPHTAGLNHGNRRRADADRTQAKKSILVQAYSFTSAPIAGALRDAHKRGVKVTVVLDKSQRSEKYSSADFLRNSGIATFVDSRHSIAHNKIMVLDGETVITGSFNFTKAAESSDAENLLIIRDAEIAEKYARNWGEHFKHSEAYMGKATR